VWLTNNNKNCFTAAGTESYLPPSCLSSPSLAYRRQFWETWCILVGITGYWGGLLRLIDNDLKIIFGFVCLLIFIVRRLVNEMNPATGSY